MSISHLLEEFSDIAPRDVIELSELRLEEERLEAFEKGYQAGWDDSATAGHSETDDATRRISQTLQHLSFTYHEAYAGALNALGPVVRQLVDTVLPQIARGMIGPQVTQLLQDMVAQHGRQPVTLSCSTEDVDALQQISAGADAMPLNITVDQTLVAGQVRLRFGTVAESELDLGAVIAGVSGALDAFFETHDNDNKEIA